MPAIHVKTIRRALLEGRFPEDVARRIKQSLRIFLIEPRLFRKPGLRGPAKQAELVVKLAFWLAKGQLSEEEFRTWADAIPPEDNAGWDVDLLRAAPGSPFRDVLKMGRLDAEPGAGRVQDATPRRPLP